MNTLSGLIVFIGFLLGGLWCGYSFCRAALATSRSKRWPVVRGTIVRSGIAPRQRPRRGTWLFLEPEITYRYEVKGRTYEASAVRPTGEMAGDAAQAQRLVRRYPVGIGVPVFYDPQNPNRAALEPALAGVDWFILACAGFGIGLGVLGVATVIVRAVGG